MNWIQSMNRCVGPASWDVSKPKEKEAMNTIEDCNEAWDLGYKEGRDKSPVQAGAQPAQEQRTWVGLTDEEIWTVLQFRGYSTDTIEIVRAIEAKLKELNT